MDRPKLTCWSCGGMFVDIGKQPLACPRCGSQPGVVPDFPKELLKRVAWSFASKQPKDVDALRAAIAAEYATLDNEPAPLDEVYAIPLATCRVMLSSYHIDSVLIEQKTMFTSGELLVATHRVLAPKLRKRDHHFFEGFTLKRADADKPPVYAISLGS